MRWMNSVLRCAFIGRKFRGSGSCHLSESRGAKIFSQLRCSGPVTTSLLSSGTPTRSPSSSLHRWLKRRDRIKVPSSCNLSTSVGLILVGFVWASLAGAMNSSGKKDVRRPGFESQPRRLSLQIELADSKLKSAKASNLQKKSSASKAFDATKVKKTESNWLWDPTAEKK